MRFIGHLFAGSVAVLSLSNVQAGVITAGVQPAVAPEDFRIMTQAEEREYRAQMENLTGEARETYRNEQYKKLRERARAQGYELPEIPPWGRTAVLPPTVLRNTPAEGATHAAPKLTANATNEVETAAGAAAKTETEASETGGGIIKHGIDALKDTLGLKGSEEPETTEETPPVATPVEQTTAATAQSSEPMPIEPTKATIKPAVANTTDAGEPGAAAQAATESAEDTEGFVKRGFDSLKETLGFADDADVKRAAEETADKATPVVTDAAKTASEETNSQAATTATDAAPEQVGVAAESGYHSLKDALGVSGDEKSTESEGTTSTAATAATDTARKQASVKAGIRYRSLKDALGMSGDAEATADVGRASAKPTTDTGSDSTTTAATKTDVVAPTGTETEPSIVSRPTMPGVAAIPLETPTGSGRDAYPTHGDIVDARRQAHRQEMRQRFERYMPERSSDMSPGSFASSRPGVTPPAPPAPDRSPEEVEAAIAEQRALIQQRIDDAIDSMGQAPTEQAIPAPPTYGGQSPVMPAYPPVTPDLSVDSYPRPFGYFVVPGYPPVPVPVYPGYQGYPGFPTPYRGTP